MHALAQPVSSITATSTADQIAQAKKMDTPVKFQGGKRLRSKWIKFWGGKRIGSKSIKFRGGKRLGSKSMGRWRRYSDATTIKDALQAGGTPSDMRNDFEKGLMVIENFQTPEPVRGSGNLRYMAILRFTFHTVNCSASVRSSYARAFVRGLPCGHKDRAKVAADPTPTQRRSKTHYKRLALRAT